jgi:hypothetical protein
MQWNSYRDKETRNRRDSGAGEIRNVKGSPIERSIAKKRLLQTAFLLKAAFVFGRYGRRVHLATEGTEKQTDSA